MNPTLREDLRTHPGHRLALAIPVAAAVHALLIAGVQFAPPTVPSDPVLSFNVSLVERVGSGPEHAPLAPTPTPPKPLAAAAPAETEPLPPPQAPAEAETAPPAAVTEVTTTAIAPGAAAHRAEAPRAERPRPQPPAPRPAEPRTPRPAPPPRPSGPPSALDLMSSGLDMAANELATPPAASSRGRTKRADPNDTTSIEGYYAAAWVQKVERIGTLNFPEEARRRSLTGNLVMTVQVRADGGVQSIVINRSSGIPALDAGARRIVELGAPYAAFPAELRQKYDVLAITRTWQFLQGAQLRSSR